METLLIILAVAIVGAVAILPIWLWSRRIEKRTGPPSNTPRENERFRFTHGAEPPGGAGSGTISGVS
jgi:hypothetical protein